MKDLDVHEVTPGVNKVNTVNTVNIVSSNRSGAVMVSSGSEDNDEESSSDSDRDNQDYY